MSAALLPQAVDVDHIALTDVTRMAEETRLDWLQACAADAGRRGLPQRRSFYLGAWQVIARHRPHLAGLRHQFLLAGGVE